MDDFNVRVTWRPCSNLTAVSRYDFQQGTTDTRGDFLGMVQSADITAHILSESITWSPLPRLYIQARCIIPDETDTPPTSASHGRCTTWNDYWNAASPPLRA